MKPPVVVWGGWLTCLVVMVGSGSAAAERLDLVAAYELASDEDVTLQERVLIHESESLRLRQARAGMGPSLQGIVTYGQARDVLRAPGQPFVVPGSETYTTYGYNLLLYQPLLDRRRSSTVRRAREEVAVADRELETAVGDLVLRVAERYFGALLARDEIDLSEAELAAAELGLEIAITRVAAGLDLPASELDARARVKLAHVELIEARARSAEAREALAAMSGTDARELCRLPDGPELAELDPPDPELWVARAREENPELELMRALARVSDSERVLRRSMRYPQLHLVGRSVVIDQEGSIAGPGLETRDTDVFLQLTIPILDGEGNRARARAAALEHQADLKRVEALERAVEVEVRAAVREVGYTRLRADALEDTVAARAVAAEERKEGLKRGLYTPLEAYLAERDLAMAKRDLFRARHDYLLGTLRLRRTASTLSVEDLRRIDQWLDCRAS